MNINLLGATDELKTGLENFLCHAGHFNFNKDISLEITVSKLDNDSGHCIKVSNIDGCKIEYKNTVHFFRALGILAEHLDDAGFCREETAAFESCSNMIDLSRNSVYTVDELKKMLTYLAITGHDKCYLYMEDTYELDGYDYFGYLRGRLSAAELKAIDDFAFSLGIEAVPCIQTLAHLSTTLKWNYAKEMYDNSYILLVGEKKTYDFIEAMFISLKKTFRTNIIHVGMDEAMSLGRGNYFNKNGFKNQYEIMTEHLNHVTELAKKHDLVPMIWDDMFYRSLNADYGYYNHDINLTDEHIAKTPPCLKLVYWDYYHVDVCEYEFQLSMRDRFENDIVFAGGIWRWMGFVPSYSKTFAATNAALAACKNHNVKEILSTAWGDDGSETPIETIIPGLILFAEHCYGQQVSQDAISNRCEFLTGVSLEEFMAIEQLDLLPDAETPNKKSRNPSKHILYQDVLLGAFDTCFDRDDLEAHFKRVGAELMQTAGHAGDLKPLFIMYGKLAAVLEKKVKLGINLRKAYKAGNKAEIKAICDTLPALCEAVMSFKHEYANVWFSTSKGHGFEVIDIRIGGVISRLDTVMRRLKAYLDGTIMAIEELEETILPFEIGGGPQGSYNSYNEYKNIATQNVLCQ